MENVTSTISGDTGLNHSATKRHKNSGDGTGELNSASSSGESLVSAAAVAAEASEDKRQSLSALETIAESISVAVEVLNQSLSLKNTSAVIRRDEQLNRYLVTIKDKDSGEVVREIPDEALLKFARNLQELRGILFDETT